MDAVESDGLARRSWRYRGKRWAFLLLASALVLLLFEGILRLAGLPSGRVRAVGHLLADDLATFERQVGPFRPGIRAIVSWPPERSYEVVTNSLGLRGPEMASMKAEGCFRILCLGDSTTFGFYVGEADTYPARLQRALSDRTPGRYEVLNAGCGGFSIAEAAILLKERSTTIEPDAAILLVSPNDLADLAREPWWDTHRRLLSTGGGRVRRVLEDTALAELALRIRILLKSAFRGDEKAAPPETQAPVEALWAAYELWLDDLVKEARARGSKLLVVAYPDAAWVVGAAAPDLPSRLAALCRSREVAYLDPTPFFRNVQNPPSLYYLPDDPHPTARGNARLAEAIAEKLQELGW